MSSTGASSGGSSSSGNSTGGQAPDGGSPGDGGTGGVPDASLPLYSIGGVVSGLVGGGLLLEDDGADALALDAGGPFTFATRLPRDAGYDVTVAVQPSGPPQSCAVANGQGVIGSSDVTDVQVSCCVPAPSGILSWWRFEPPSPGADEFGVNDFTNPVWTIDGGEVGSAMTGFSGSGPSVPLSVGFPAGDADRTIELWARVSRQDGGTAYFADYGLLDVPNHVDFGADAGAFFGLGVDDAGLFFTEGSAVIQGPALSLGGWHHVAVTASDGGVALFLDGQQVATARVALNTPPGTPFNLGYASDPAESAVVGELSGALDEVAVYDRALSPQEVQALFQAGSQGKCVVGACRAGESYLNAGCACTESAAELQSDPANCGQCGSACGGGSCEQGSCATFTGAFQFGGCGYTQSGGAGGCLVPNPETGACLCPGEIDPSGAGQPFWMSLRFTALSPQVVGTCPVSQMSLCTLGQPADLLGLYEMETTAGGTKCLPFNEWSGSSVGCACSAGTPLNLPVVLGAAMTPATVTLCLGPALPDPSFGGAFELDDPDAGGGCRVPNPATSACACPAAMADLAYPVLVRDTDAGVITSSIHFCGPAT